MDLVEASEFHLGRMKLAGRKPATIRLYSTYQAQFLAFLEMNHLPPSLDRLNVETVEDCMAWIRGTARGSRGGAQAARMFVTIMKVLSTFLWRRKLYEVDPLARLQRPQVPKLHRKPFSAEEARRLLAAVATGNQPIRDRAILLLLVDTGCRVGELAALTLADIQDSKGQLTGRALFRVTKSGTPRDVIFRIARRGGGPCESALRQWLKTRTAQPGVDEVFVTTEGWPLLDRRIRELHYRYGEAAGVPHCMPHRWRHTHVTELLTAQPGAEEHVRHRVGHMDPAVLRDYLTISNPMAEQIAEVASVSRKWNL